MMVSDLNRTLFFDQDTATFSKKNSHTIYKKWVYLVQKLTRDSSLDHIFSVPLSTINTVLNIKTLDSTSTCITYLVFTVKRVKTKNADPHLVKICGSAASDPQLQMNKKKLPDGYFHSFEGVFVTFFTLIKSTIF